MKASQSQFLEFFSAWAQAQPLVRAALITSTFALPGADPDILSDYDIVLILQDVRPFYASRAWLNAFGKVLALYRDPLQEVDGFQESGYVIQFNGGLKIDFTLLECGKLRQIAQADALPDEYDAGYRVLLDKDGLSAGMRPPSYRAYIPTPPAYDKYIEMIENFFLESGYAAKYLWRDDLMGLKFILDYCMKQEHLLPLLEWHAECQHGWNLKTGPHGRGLKQWLRADLWAALEATYSGPGLQENWQTLERMIALMSKTAREVGACLGYAYPQEMETEARAYIELVRRLPRGAQSIDEK